MLIKFDSKKPGNQVFSGLKTKEIFGAWLSGVYPALRELERLVRDDVNTAFLAQNQKNLSNSFPQLFIFSPILRGVTDRFANKIMNSVSKYLRSYTNAVRG